MTNIIKGKFDFVAAGKTYSLQFTANGMCELEAAANCSTMAFLKRMEANAENDLSFIDVRLLFWAGLQEHHPELTVKDAGRIVQDMGGLAEAMTLAGQAVQSGMPQDESGGNASGGKAMGAS